MNTTSKVRIDKWLWSVRIFKSRTIATDACKGGKVKLNNTNVKPSSLVQKDDVLIIRKNGFDFQFKVVELIEKRVSAAIAQQCYENITPQEEMNKYSEWFAAGKASAEKRDRGTGRPTKKERREIDDYKEGWFDFEDWED
jgi:ribosome-associated heat shock protein Hsp15